MCTLIEDDMQDYSEAVKVSRLYFCICDCHSFKHGCHLLIWSKVLHF